MPAKDDRAALSVGTASYLRRQPYFRPDDGTPTMGWIMPVAKLTDDHGWHGLRWWCPGCDDNHVARIDGTGSAWGFNDSLDAPTLTPSVLIYSREKLNDAGHAALEAGRALTDAHRTITPQCHSFIRDGRIEFLSDCGHELAGQTVPMCPLPEG